MPTLLECNRETGKCLAFDFPTDWQAVKYDQQEDPKTDEAAGFDRRIIQSGGVKNVRGVDIVCRLPAGLPRLQFIEIKDDRLRTKGTGERHTELYETVLQKTLGTLAGLLLAERLGDESLRPMACLSLHPAIEVVLFLEEPPATPVPDVGNKRALRRLARSERKTDLDQRLTAKLNQWGLSFRLFNLTDRPAHPWGVRQVVREMG